MKIRILDFFTITTVVCWAGGCASSPTGQAPSSNTEKATVRSVRGVAHYSANGASSTLKPGMTLSPGAAILTGEDSDVYASVNGITSKIRVSPSSELDLQEMNSVGSGTKAHKETILNLKKGSILGQVKSLTNNSAYEIRTPKGVATIYDGDFSITVQPSDNGDIHVNFVCLRGTVSVSAEISGQTKAVELRNSQQCDVGAEFSAVKPFEIQFICTYPPPGGLIPPLLAPLPVFAPPISIIQPFDGNGPPRQTIVSLPPAHR